MTALGGNVTLTRRPDDWHACITGHPEKWECGVTASEALGDLVFQYGDELVALIAASAVKKAESEESSHGD